MSYADTMAATVASATARWAINFARLYFMGVRSVCGNSQDKSELGDHTSVDLSKAKCSAVLLQLK